MAINKKKIFKVPTNFLSLGRKRQDVRRILSLLFLYSFVFYLVLFLLETVFPGFISQKFSLNHLLVLVLVFGILSFTFPEPETEKKKIESASKLDFIWILALSIGSFFLIFYKFSIDNLTLKLAISFLSGFLILVLGVILVYFPDNSRALKTKNLPVGKMNISKVRRIIPVHLTAIFIIVLLLFVPKFTVMIKDTVGDHSNKAPAVISLKANPNIKIIIYNGGIEAAEVVRFVGIFKEEGYGNVEVSNYPVGAVDYASIQFRDSDSVQADLIEDILKNDYSTIDRWPLATTSAEIHVILGNNTD